MDVILRCIVLALCGSSVHPAPTALVRQEAGLEACWRLSSTEMENGSFRDLAGDRALSPQSQTRFLGEAASEALVLDPEGSYLVVDPNASPKSLPRKRLTLEAWVVVDQARSWGGFLSAIEDDEEFERGWLLGHKNDRLVFALATEDTGRLTFLESTNTFRRSRWYHVAGTYDGKVQRLYVDGELSAESEAPGGDILYDEEHQFVAGAFVDQNEEHRTVGALYELRLYDRACSGKALERRYKSELELLPSFEGTASGLEIPVAPPVGDLQPAINEAIARGVEHLLRSQNRDGSWSQDNERYPNGMTSLALYTLVKSGLPANHPALGYALGFLRERNTERTYSLGCQLLALHAMGARVEPEWIETLAQRLVEYESREHRGSWAYPDAHVDLSNTQFAALGLWAAHQAGVEVDRDVWERMVERTLEEYQSRSIDVAWESGKRFAKRPIAGFTYRPGPNERATGSMTTAGLCVMALAERCTKGKLSGRLKREMRSSTRLGLDWLDHSWSVQRNPGKGDRYYYYMYGLERVGAFLQLDHIGDHAWYREGAEALVRKQQESGAWGNDSETCFALLFLARATAPVSGGKSIKANQAAWQLAEGPVRFRATGGMHLVLWITDFDDDVLTRFDSLPPDRRGLRIVKVEYVLDGQVVESATGDPGKPWGGERYSVRHSVASVGEHELRVRVHAVQAGDASGSFGETAVIESDPLPFTAAWTSADFKSALRPNTADNLLVDPLVRVTTSSEKDEAHAAAKAADGFAATSWLAEATDTDPWIRIQLEQPTRLDTLVFSQAASRLVDLGKYDPITRVEVIVDGDRGRFEIELNQNELLVTEFELPEPLQASVLEIRVLARRDSADEPLPFGFAEIEAALRSKESR